MTTDPLDDMMDLAPAGLICYDAECVVCRRAVRWLHRLSRHGFAFLPLQHPLIRQRLGSGMDVPNEFKLIRPGQAVLGGALAIQAVLAALPSTRPLARFTGTRIGFAVIDKAYRWIAEHRHCHAAHVCGISRSSVRDGVWLSLMAGVLNDLLGDWR
jgi:predicted DCC family thiol-disulfide oxidoreductase YuxK